MQNLTINPRPNSLAHHTGQIQAPNPCDRPAKKYHRRYLYCLPDRLFRKKGPADSFGAIGMVSKSESSSVSASTSHQDRVFRRDTLAGHANFATTHRFYLAVADDLVARARQATIHQVSQELLQSCCRSSQKGTNP